MASASQVEHQSAPQTTTRALLRSLGWGSSYAANALRVPVRNVQRWVSGEHEPPPAVLVTLRAYLVLSRVAPGVRPATLWTDQAAFDYLNDVREPARMRRAEGFRSLRDGADG